MNEQNQQMTKLIHAVGTAQLLLDELTNIQDDAKLGKIMYFKHEIKKSVNRFIKDMKPACAVLTQIWTHISNEDFDRYLESKRLLLDKIQESTFEDVNQLAQLVDEVHARYYMLDVFERMLNTHCVPAARDVYRKELGYTEEQYHELKRMQEKGYVRIYDKPNHSHQKLAT